MFIEDVLSRDGGVFSSVGSGESFTGLSEPVSVFFDGITNSLLFFSSDVFELSILKRDKYLRLKRRMIYSGRGNGVISGEVLEEFSTNFRDSFIFLESIGDGVTNLL